MNDTLYCLPRCYSSNVRCMLPFLVGSVPGRSISRAASLSFCWMFPESHHQRSFRLELLSQVFDTVNRTIMKKISYPRHSRNNSITKPWTIPYPYPYSSCHPMTHLPRHPLRQWEASFDIWLTDQPAMLRERKAHVVRPDYLIIFSPNFKNVAFWKEPTSWHLNSKFGIACSPEAQLRQVPPSDDTPLMQESHETLPVCHHQ